MGPSPPGPSARDSGVSDAESVATLAGCWRQVALQKWQDPTRWLVSATLICKLSQFMNLVSIKTATHLHEYYY